VENYTKVESESIANLIIECWRLSKVEPKNPKDKIALSKFNKQLLKFLSENSIQVLDLKGHEYEPGLALEIVYTENSSIEKPDLEIITEMVSPLIIINGSVVKHGQVVTKKILNGGL
jgi:hypothetical protein